MRKQINKQTTKKKSNLHSLWKMTEKYKALYLSSLGAIALTAACEASGNLIIRQAVDDVILKSKEIQVLVLLVGFFLLISAVRASLSFFSGKGTARTSENITRDIRKTLFDHMQRLSFGFHDKNQTGELIQRATSDVDAVRRFYADQIPGIARIIFMFSINITVLLFLHWKLALLSIVTIPLTMGLSLFFFDKILNLYETYQNQEGHVTSAIQENLNGIRVVRAFSRQDWEKSKFEKKNAQQLADGKRLMFWEAAYWPASHLICGAQFLLVLTLSSIMTIKGEITPGTFIAFTALVDQIIWPLRELGRMITELSKSTVSFNRIEKVLSEDQERMVEKTNPPHSPLNGKIHFDHVSFEYEKDTPVLKDISFSCNKGDKVALIGETGSGKTSLVNLLPRFYEKTEGSITLGDCKISELSKHDLRRKIGIVEQDPFLFSMTIKENIALGFEGEASQEEIEKAAKAAAIHESILDFKEGYDTRIGERGVSLSGGQKQRIVIARTLLKDPEVLILDDATSAVDAETEASINQALEELMKGRTTFIIAHRLQSLKKADKILVLKEGQIIQEGLHEELIQKTGFYKDVFDLQTQIEEELQEEMKNA